MSLKMKVWTLLDIALRVPPIFLMDAALKYELRARDVPPLGDQDAAFFADKNNTETLNFQPWLSVAIIEEIGFSLLSLLLHIQVLFIAVFVFLFNTKQLLSIYIRLASIGIIIFAYELNMDYVNLHLSKLKCSTGIQNIVVVFSSYLLQFILAVLFAITNSVTIYPQGAIVLLFLIPTLTCTVSLPEQFIKITPVLSATGSTVLLAYSMWIHGLRVCETVYKGITWCHSVVENYGLYTMIETHWINLNIPQVFRVFWLIRMGEYLINILKDYNSLSIIDIFKGIIINGSENIIALIGMTSVVSFISQSIGYNIQKFLKVSDPSEKNISNISAVLFLLLSLQTGITSFDSETRFYRVCRNLCLLYTALLHFIHNILNPILLSLSASRNPSLDKHARALTVALFLIITPTIVLVYQWKTNEASTWLFASTSFMIELIIKTSMSVAIYMLFTIDTYKNGLWENLDDYVYYLKGASSLTEFILGIYLLLNGLWIFIFESSGAIRACMMCLHAYFNIWIQGKSGWESFLLRRSALQKINFLQEATKEQLKHRNDVCAICFQDLNTARVTKCNHFFHGVCLRKWLNVQETCPLCHTRLCNSSLSQSFYI